MEKSTIKLEEEDVLGEQELHELSQVELIFWCLAYLTIAMLAIVGNTLVIFITICRLTGPKTLTTFFIVNLAVADLLTGVFAIPFKFHAALLQEWLLPNVLCHVAPYAETVTLSVSVFTLTASAIYEFRTVFLSKHSARLNHVRAWVLVLTIWVFAASISLPFGMYHDVFETPVDNETVVYQCRPVYPEEAWWKAYNIYLIILQYFVPVVIIDATFMLIFCKLWKTKTAATEEAQVLSQHSAAPVTYHMDMSNRKLMKMLIIVVAAFTLCWLPLEIYFVLNELVPVVNEYRYINVMFFTFHLLAMSNSCLNPIIYYFYNAKYHREFCRIHAQLLCRDFDDIHSPTDPSRFDAEFQNSTARYSSIRQTYPNKCAIRTANHAYVNGTPPPNLLNVKEFKDTLVHDRNRRHFTP